MARANGLDKLSYAELAELRDQVDMAMVAAKKAEKEALRKEIEELAAKSGLTLDEVLGSKSSRKGGKVAAKYRNPKDPSQTWAGRGRQPLWLVAALKKGQKIESFLV